MPPWQMMSNRALIYDKLEEKAEPSLKLGNNGETAVTLFVVA